MDPIDEALRRITKYDDHVRDAARARIGSDLARIQAQLRADVLHARNTGNPVGLTEARHRAATALRALRPAIGPQLRDAINEGVRLGAELAGGPLPAGVNPAKDPALKATLQRMNTPIRRHARTTARYVTTGPLRTDAQLEHMLDRITAVLADVDAAASAVTTRAVDIGTAAVTDALGVGRIWVVRPGCCPACASYSGAVAAPGGGFQPRASYADAAGQWEEPHGGISGPPLHAHCACACVPEVPRLADRLARRTQADVAAGRVAASAPARVRAVQRLLASSARLTQRTRERASNAAARGRFAGQSPANRRRTPSA